MNLNDQLQKVQKQAVIRSIKEKLVPLYYQGKELAAKYQVREPVIWLVPTINSLVIELEADVQLHDEMKTAIRACFNLHDHE